MRSKEISNSNISLSESTTGQASSLDEMADSMEQMTATVLQNADSAGQAQMTLLKPQVLRLVPVV
jgi:methyl-accepting chemotaxis protein